MHAITQTGACGDSAIQSEKKLSSITSAVHSAFLWNLPGQNLSSTVRLQRFPREAFSFLYWKIKQENFVSDSVELEQINSGGISVYLGGNINAN